MSVLVYTESWEGNFRKSTYEAVSYASETAKLLGTDVVALSFGNVNNDELSKLGNYGANKVLTASGIKKGDSKAATHLFATNSSKTSLIRSSKSPLYFEPATIAPMSILHTSLSASNGGTSPSTIFLASSGMLLSKPL